MDPVSITFAVVAAVNLGQRIGGLARKVHRVEGAKVDQIYYRLVAENAKTKGWANQLRDRNGNDFLSSIDPAEFEEVSLLMHRLEKYHDEARIKYEGIKAAGDQGRHLRERMKANLRFIAGGYDDLKVITDTLAAMNEALRSMVPILPSYDGGPATSTRPPRALQEEQSISDSDHHVTRVRHDPSANAPAPENSAPIAEDAPLTLPSIQTIWRLAAAGLTKIAMAKRDNLLKICAGRLKLWGLGLFEDGFTLDDVLVSRISKDSPFYRVLISSLANILLLEEREIKTITADGEDQRCERLLQVKLEITALLGTDELVVIAVEEWSNQFTLSRQIAVEGAFGGTPSHTQNPVEGNDALMSKSVESLFELLPGIRAERRAYCYDIQSSREQINHSKELIEQDSTSLASIKKQFEDVKIIIDARDKTIQKEGRSDVLAPTFAKVQARLEEFKDNKERAMSEGDKKQDREIQPMLEEMSQILGRKTLELWNPLILQATFLGSMKPSPPNEGPSDIKHLLKDLDAKPNLIKKANEALRDLIGTLNSDLSALHEAKHVV